MRIGLLLLCFYGLSSSAAHASTLSTEDLPPDYRISLSSLLRSVRAVPDIALNRGDANGFLISSARAIKINPGADITISAKPSLLTAGNITLLPGGNISLSGLRKGDLTSATLTPQLSGGDITIGTTEAIIAGVGALAAGNIDAGRGHLSAKNVTILPGGNISLGSGIRIPSDLAPRAGGEIVIASRGDIITMSGVSVASVPLPASFYMLMTGLLTLVSVSKRSLFGKA